MTIRRWRDSAHKHPGFVVLGILVFLLASAAMNSVRYPFLADPRDIPIGAFSPAVLGMLAICALLARSPRGRAFDAGFLGSLLVAVVFIRSIFFISWYDPYFYVSRHTRRAFASVTAKRETERRDRNWRDSVHTVGLNGDDGAGRALNLGLCMRVYRETSARHAWPPDSAALANVSPMCVVKDGVLGQRRSGWQWLYRPPTSGDTSFAIEIYPDTSLGFPGPRFVLDSRGLVLSQERPEAPGLIVISPVPALRALRQCIDSAASKARNVWGRAVSLHDINGMDWGPCQPLHLHYVSSPMTKDSSIVMTDDNALEIRLPLGIRSDTVSRMSYLVRYEPKGRSPRDGYDLNLRPPNYQPGTIRSYALLNDGSLHATSEHRAATASDPAPMACELDVTVPCPRQ